jgi:hypothetical protein
MMNKTKLALAMLLLLQIAPAQAAGRQHSNRSGALPAYEPFDHSQAAYPGSLSNDPAYDFARAVFGWNAGLYPFDYTPGSRPRPLRSNGKCWVNTGGGNLGWAPC